MRHLIDNEFIQSDITAQEIRFVSTRLGAACLAASISPIKASPLFLELQKAQENFILETELHAVYLVTPFSVCHELYDIDWNAYLNIWDRLLPKSMQRVGELVGIRDSIFNAVMSHMKKVDAQQLQIHKR